MPGRNHAEAIEAYIEPLQQSLSCFGKDVLRPSGYEPNRVQVAALGPIQLITRSGEVLHLSFAQTFHLEKRVLINWKVCTNSYIYSLTNDTNQEIIAYHWHPETNPENPIPYPHMHIKHGAGRAIRQEILDIHFRTGRMAFERFALMLIEDFQVDPDRKDAKHVLQKNLKKFVDHKSW